MALKVRNYSGPEDYYRVSEFLTRHHRPGNRDRNWLEPMWEYMHFHPMLDSTSVERIGIWEDAGEIVAMVNYESTLGEAFFQFHPAYHHLHVEMLDYAETHLTGVSQKDGRTYLAAFVPEDDAELRALVQARGYEVRPEMLESGSLDRGIELAAEQAGLPFFEATATFRARKDDPGLFFPLDGHMTEAGHELYAEGIAPKIETLVQGKAPRK